MLYVSSRQKLSKRAQILAVIALVLLASPSAFAVGEEVPYFTYQGKLLDAIGNPLVGPHTFIFTITSPLGTTCVLYEETQIINLGALGTFAAQVGSLVGDPKRTANDPLPPHQMAVIFTNNGGAIAATGGCGTYTPVGYDVRYLHVTVDGTALVPDQVIATIPNAWVAETIQGMPLSGLILNAGNVTQANLGILTAGAASDASALHNHYTQDDARYARTGTAAQQNFGSGDIDTTGHIYVGASGTDSGGDMEI